MARDYLIKVWVKETRAACVRPFVLYNQQEMYENTERFVLLRNIARNVYTEAHNKRQITSLVLFCNPWGSKPTEKSKDFECYCIGRNCE